MQGRDGLPDDAAGASSWPVVIQVSPQQAGSGMTRRAQSHRREQLDRGPAGVGGEAVGERVGPDPHVGRPRPGRRPAAQRALGERGQAAALVDAGRGLRDPGRPPCCAASCWPAGGGVEPGPARQLAEGVVGARPQPAGGTSARAPRTCRSPCRCRSGSRGRSPCRTGRGRARRRRPGRRSRASPLATSWSTWARPRVESFSSLVARYDGHITPPVAGVVGEALADAGAAVHGVGERAGVVRQPQGGAHRLHGRGEPEVGVERRRVDEHAGVEQVAGVEDPLGLLHQGDRLGRVHPRQQLGAGATVAVLAGHRAAVRRHQVGRVLDEGAEARAAAGVLELEVDAHVHAAVAEVAVGDAVEGAVAQQRVEVAQVGAEPRGRDGGVLPARPAPGGSASAAARPAPSSRMRQSAACSRGRRRRGCGTPAYVGDRAGPATRPRRGVAGGHLGEQPAAAVGQVGMAAAPCRRSAGRDPRRPTEVVLEQGGHGVRGLGHVGVRQDGEGAGGGVLDQPDGRVERRRRGCPRCRRGTGRSADRARAAGARRSSRRPAGRRCRTRCGRWPGAGRPASVERVDAAAARRPRCRRRAARSAPRRCRRCGRSPAPASRRRCCRSSRRSCSGCGSRGRGRTAARRRPPASAARRARRPAGRGRCVPRGRGRGSG